MPRSLPRAGRLLPHPRRRRVGAPLIPLLDHTGQCPSLRRCISSPFTPMHRLAAVSDAPSAECSLSPLGIGIQAIQAFTMSAGSNATCPTASSASGAFLPTCSCPVDLSIAGKLVAQTPPSSVSRLSRGYDDAPHGAHGACGFPAHRSPASFAPSGYRSDLNAARSSFENSSGCSHAAKWPPLSTSLK